MNLPLHGGHAPQYLVRRMIKLCGILSEIIVNEHGTEEFLRKISDPLWFQSFGCVLGFDWHSSGLTTVVSGVLSKSIDPNIHDIVISGGKGKNALKPKHQIPQLAENHFNMSSGKINELVYASKMTVKVDGALIQDGYNLYHHAILFDKKGNWTVFQQGLNQHNRMARRYHWISDGIYDYLNDSHSGIICLKKHQDTLNMAAKESENNRKTCVDIINEGKEKIIQSVSKLSKSNTENSLDRWIDDSKSTKIILPKEYEMPRNLDWKLMDKLYDLRPTKYEELITVKGVGPSTVRALALIAELIYGNKASWNDPVKYNFAHGGKDGVPYPVSKKTYDKSIKYLIGAVEASEVERNERINSLKRLHRFSEEMFGNISSSNSD